MSRPILPFTLCLFLLPASPASSFCGFYVASGDARLFNHSSQVAMVRDGDRTVLSMANDFQGDPKQFAIVVPVPTVLRKDQIHVGDRALLEHLDQYSAPRLVEYYDENPCAAQAAAKAMALRGGRASELRFMDGVSAAAEVRIEARYTVGEYDILILSATESRWLETWLRTNGYRVPPGASRVLGTYLKLGMKFFVAKVNLTEQHKLGFTYLRPIQIAYESPKFMLPIRLGMVNADGPQELFIFALTRKGRVETTNYRTVKLPSNREIPEYVKNVFPDFYRAMFARAVERNDRQAVFTEYAWDMSGCDPCASPPLSPDELKGLGVFWIDDAASPGRAYLGARPSGVFLTRLHVRYDRDHFPEDLVFQETADRANFQGRYILRHPWTGTDECDETNAYHAALAARRRDQANALVDLTGWPMEDVRARMGVGATWVAEADTLHWWQRLWK